MDASERLRVAGEAAALLEGQGYVSAARMRDGVVRIELWRVINGQQHMLKHTIEGEVSAEELAATCHAVFEASRREGARD